MTDRELMGQALDVLEDIFGKNKIDVGVINRLRDRLAQPERDDGVCRHCNGVGCVACDARHLPKQEPRREWQGLTDEDVDEVERWVEWKEIGSGRIPTQKLVRYIEAKLKAKTHD